MKKILRILKTILIVIVFQGKRKFKNFNKDVEIYIMTCHRDTIKLIVALYSIYEYFGKSIQIIINHDQTLTQIDILLIKSLFKNIKILSNKDFNRIKKQLSQFHYCNDFYKSWMGKKFLNPLLLTKKKKVILLDSDIYFIKKPKKIINFINKSYKKSLYTEDLPGWFLLSRLEFKYIFGLKTVDKLNSSLLCLNSKYIPTLKQINKAIHLIYRLKRERFMDYSFLLEQTLFIYLYSRIPKKEKEILYLRHYFNLAVINKYNILNATSIHFSTPSKHLWWKYIWLTRIGLFKYNKNIFQRFTNLYNEKKGCL